MYRQIKFYKALEGASKNMNGSNCKEDYNPYTSRIVQALNDLHLEQIRRTENLNMDSKSISRYDKGVLTDTGKEIWSRNK